jgi:Gamma-glutamyl cyclotransferase, AIG2-like
MGATLGSALSAALFPPADWTSAEPEGFPERPYPGWRPRGSWRLTRDGRLHALQPTTRGWVDRFTGEPVSTGGRRLVLGYGSNLNPAKLAARLHGEEIFSLRAAVVGWAAAWCDGRRGTGDVVATLVPVPGHVEVHAVLALTDAQVELMDGWEGHPRWYRRQPVAGTLWMEDGTLLMGDNAQTDVEVYLGCDGVRSPLLIAGRPLLCAAAPHDEVSQLLDPARTP